MGEKPAEAVRGKPDSSLVRAVRAVGEGEADAVVSAGNTGAALAASLLHVRRLPGVHRPGIAIVIPSRRGPTVLIDAGANADARPEHLVQFAHMGVVFAQELLDVPEPSVRLLSIGEEPEKGNQLTLEAHALLTEADLRFEGNTEGRSLLEGDADVVVCDGFTGNVALKTLEGTIRGVLGALRDEISSSRRARLGGWLIRPAARGLRAATRSRHVRRWLPARAPRPRRDCARLQLANRDRECHPDGCPRGRPPARRAPCRAAADERREPAGVPGDAADRSRGPAVIVLRSIHPVGDQ